MEKMSRIGMFPDIIIVSSREPQQSMSKLAELCQELTQSLVELLAGCVMSRATAFVHLLFVAMSGL